MPNACPVTSAASSADRTTTERRNRRIMSGIETTKPDDTSGDSQRRTPGRAALASFMGSAVEYYDFFLFGQAAALIFPKVFFPSGDEAALVMSFATFGVAYVARPVGAFVLGHFGDRIGRRRVLMFTIILMGISTFAIGCLPIRYGRLARSRPSARILHVVDVDRHPGWADPRVAGADSVRPAVGRVRTLVGLARPVLAQRNLGYRRRLRPRPDHPRVGHRVPLGRGADRHAPHPDGRHRSHGRHGRPRALMATNRTDTAPTDTALSATPGQTVGPFFGCALPFDRGNELVAPGSPGSIRLHGGLTDGAGDPVPDALLEIWLTDPEGSIVTAGGSLRRDGATFTGWGRAGTD